MHTEIITSRTNRLIKKIVALQNKKQRDKEALMWVEGLKCVKALIESNYQVEEIVVSTSAQEVVKEYAASLVGKINYAAEHCFAKCSVLKNPEGIGALAVKPNYVALPKEVLVPALVLWQIGDPGNMGCLIRTATGLGVKTIVVVGPAVDIYHPMSIRGSVGSIFYNKIYQIDSQEALKWLKERRTVVAGLTGDGKNILSKMKGKEPQILIIGSEAHGLPVEIRRKFSGIKLPMRNKVESLNVSTATAIAIYNLWGERDGDITL